MQCIKVTEKIKQTGGDHFKWKNILLLWLFLLLYAFAIYNSRVSFIIITIIIIEMKRWRKKKHFIFKSSNDWSYFCNSAFCVLCLNKDEQKWKMLEKNCSIVKKTFTIIRRELSLNLCVLYAFNVIISIVVLFYEKYVGKWLEKDMHENCDE